MVVSRSSRVAVPILIAGTAAIGILSVHLDAHASSWAVRHPYTTSLITGLMSLLPTALATVIVVDRILTGAAKRNAAYVLRRRRTYVETIIWHILDGIAIGLFGTGSVFTDTGELALAVSAKGGYLDATSLPTNLSELVTHSRDEPNLDALRSRSEGYGLLVEQLKGLADADPDGTWTALADRTSIAKQAYTSTIEDYDPSGQRDDIVDADLHGLCGKLLVHVTTLRQTLDSFGLAPWHGPTRQVSTGYTKDGD